MTTVTACTSEHAEEWDAFVARHPRATFYHRWGWKEINQRQFGHETSYLAARSDGRIVGILPLVCVKTVLFGTIACTMPFVNYGGPASDDPATDRLLVDEAIAQARRWEADYLELRTRHLLDGDLAVSHHKVSMTVELPADPDVLWNRFKTGHRQEIRRAAKNGLTARFGPDLLDAFYEVVAESWHELGTPFYRKAYFAHVLEAFPDHVRVCVLFDRAGRPAAAAMDGLHRETVEGMWLGIRPAYRTMLAGYGLYWELIKHACCGG
jgi:FemAB-related protein (PEP-CTERM system-associated)